MAHKSSFFLIACLLLCQAHAQSVPDFKGIYNKTKDSVVRILVRQDKKGPYEHSGTGWLYKDSTHIVTAYHVIAGEGEPFLVPPYGIELSFTDGSKVDIEDKEIIKHVFHSNANDIAVIVFDSKIVRKPLVMADRNPELGDWVFGSGYGMFNDDQSLFHGLITGGLCTFNYAESTLGCTAMRMDAMIVPGHSGSAVLSGDGKIYGLAVACSRKYQSANWFIPRDLLLKELDKLVK